MPFSATESVPSHSQVTSQSITFEPLVFSSGLHEKGNAIMLLIRLTAVYRKKNILPDRQYINNKSRYFLPIVTTLYISAAFRRQWWGVFMLQRAVSAIQYLLHSLYRTLMLWIPWYVGVCVWLYVCVTLCLCSYVLVCILVSFLLCEFIPRGEFNLIN